MELIVFAIAVTPITVIIGAVFSHYIEEAAAAWENRGTPTPHICTPPIRHTCGLPNTTTADTNR